MPVLVQSVVLSVAAEEPDLRPGVCQACGSARLEYLRGYFATGVTGPNGEPEMYWRETLRCRDCGEIEEF